MRLPSGIIRNTLYEREVLCMGFLAAFHDLSSSLLMPKSVQIFGRAELINALPVAIYTYFELALPDCAQHCEVQMENVITPACDTGGCRALHSQICGLTREITLPRNRNEMYQSTF